MHWDPSIQPINAWELVNNSVLHKEKKPGLFEYELSNIKNEE